MVTSPSRARTRISGRRADQREIAEVEVEQERRGIGAPECPVERERGQRERRGEALREHDLERVAGGDVLLGPVDHGEVLGRASCWRRDAALPGLSAAGCVRCGSGSSSAATTAASRVRAAP